jgi:peptide/nickel transport system substrate-binding protein
MRLCLLLVVLACGCKNKQAAPVDSAPALAGPVVVGCGPQGCRTDPGPAREGGQIVVHVEAEPAILCDLVEHDAWSRWIVENQVAETLLFQDPWTGVVGPRLAESITGDDKQLTLKLRAGVGWHDGKPFSSADVAFTLGKAKDPKVGADQRADLEPIAAIETPDAQTVVLKLGKPAPYLRQALAHISILPKHAYEGKDLRRAEASRSPIGTGPFRFVEWRPGEQIVIARHDGYWGEKAHLERVVFKIVRDKQVAWQLYQRGELDVMWRLPTVRTAEEARADTRLAGHRMYLWAPRAYFFIVYNTRRGPLADAKVRRALTQMVDRERFMKIAFNGYGRLITGPYPLGTPSYDSEIKPWPYDPKQAAEDLKAAKVDKPKLTFLLTAGSKTVEQLATLMKEDFARAGVELELATVDFAVLLERLRQHAFDISSLQWTMSLEQDNYNMFHSSQAEGGQNYGAWKNPEADALLEQIRNTADDNARHALDRKLHKLIHEQQPYTFLASPEVQTMVSRRVRGLRPSTDGFTLAQAWVELPQPSTSPAGAMKAE